MARARKYQSLLPRTRTSLWKLLPWTGLSSLILALGCGISALVIGVVSNGLPVNSWKVSSTVVQPSVLLSTAATFANALLRVAFLEGVAIQWWFRAHQGTSIADLYALHMHGYTTTGLFTILSRFNKVTLGAIVMLLLLADGPFLQRASSIQPVSHQSNDNFTVPVSSSPFVFGSTGIITEHDGFYPDIYTTAFAQVMQDYNARNPISFPQSVPGAITMDVVGPGWDIKCQNGSSPYRLLSLDEYWAWNDAASANVTWDGPASEQTMFSTIVGFGDRDIEYPYIIWVNATYKSTSGINGTLSWHNCSLNEAIVRYPVHVVDGVATLQPMPLSENRSEYLVRRNWEENSWGNYPSTVGGFYLALEGQFATSANLTTEVSAQTAVVSNENVIANQFVTPNSDLSNGYDVSWSDPIETIIAAVNEISFRAAISLTNQSTNFSCATCTQPEVQFPNLTYVNRTESQQVSATTINTFNAYQTDLAWLIGGCAIIAVACIVVTPMFWGFWRLERKFSLNPLETARAFDAPLLRQENFYAPPSAWTKSTKNINVYYGPGQAETTSGMVGQPLKVFATDSAEEDGSSQMSELNPVATQQIQTSGMDGSKFRKVD